MKTFIFVLILTGLFSTQIEARKTDVYYSNGILTKKYSPKGCRVDPDSALCDTYVLKTKLQETTFTSGPDAGKNMLDPGFVDQAVILQYNWHKGTAYDLLETYYQLKTSGQIDRALGFFGWLATLVIDTVQAVASIPGIVPSEEEIARIERANVDAMIAKYKQESVNEHDNILLISHSQGNLFANRMYDVYFSTDPGGDDHYKYRFANIQVASPADYVHAYTHDYITREDDEVMAWVPGSLDPDVHSDQLYDDICQHDRGNNHAFVKAYLECPATWNRIKTALNNFHNGKNGDGGDMPSGGCTYNPNAKHFDVMLVLMTLLSFLYPLYHGGLWIRRRYR